MCIRDRLPPVPAMIGILPLEVSTAHLIVAIFSSVVIVEASPVVPQTIIASAPLSTWKLINFLNSSKFTPESLNGVHCGFCTLRGGSGSDR